MKKFGKLAYIVLIIIIAGLSVIVYSTVSKGNYEKDGKEKALSEIEYLEGKVEMLLNKLNNIKTRNYDVSVSEVSKQKEEQKNKSQSNEGKEESGSSSDSNSSSNSNSEQEASGTSQQSETEKKYDMVKSGVLLDSGSINWDDVKSEVEILFSSLPTITLDLYQIDVSQDDILGFNKEFDKLVTVVRDENKEETLRELAILFEYVVRFKQKATDDDVTKKIVEIKSHVYNSYSKLDTKRWDEIKNETKEAVRIYNELLSNSEVETTKQYSISKGFVMINELQSAADAENVTTYLIKYKNFIEEMNNL